MIRSLLLLCCTLSPLPAAAGPLTDLLMAPHLFDATPVGGALAYREDRTVPAVEGMSVTAVTGAEIRLEKTATDDGPALRLVRVVDGTPAPLGTLPAGVANPLLLYFLETNVRVMAEATGGSPFYIRNRMREALGASDLGTDDAGGRQVVLTPFAADPKRAQMGAFADLTLQLRFDPADPARILELSADTAAGEGGYHETLVLLPEK